MDDNYLKEKKKALIEAQREMMRLLPHINTDHRNEGVPMYKWQWDFFLSKREMCLLTAANQVGKSSVQIRRVIYWATEPKLWPVLWPESYKNVAQFWYLYPTLDVATIEFEKKWVPEWMPRGKMKSDPQYGWEEEYRARKIYAIHFKTGVSIYFKSYAQNATDLQTGTVHAIATDEELPINLYDELKFRTSATSGHFSMVFTATLGQYLWECAMEKIGTKEEKFPNATKIQVSLYDCLEYTDKNGDPLKGVKTPWTVNKIEKRKESCSSESEVLKRIYGRFVMDDNGKKYADELSEENLLTNWVLPKGWLIVSAVDPGSGGLKGHPTAMSWLAVSPEYDEGVIFLAWRGDGVPTTNADAFNKYIELRGKLKVVNQFYDYHAKDFFTIAHRNGEAFEKAEKSHEIGEPILKSLLKMNALKFVMGECIGLESYDTQTQEGEIEKLVDELRNLNEDTDKRQAKDDLIDTARYNCAKIPWDWEKINKKFHGIEGKKKKEVKVIKLTNADIIQERREMFMEKKEDETIDDEIDFWNDYYGSE